MSKSPNLIVLDPHSVVVREDRVTPLNEQSVDVISQSASDTGFIRDPIHVRRTGKGYELIDGRTRLEVAKRLGLEINAFEWSCTLEEARLMEADANVTFTHMAPIDLAVSLAARKASYVRLHPDTKRGMAGAAARHGGMQTTEMSFASFMAKIVGVSERQIQRVISAGEALNQNNYLALRQSPRRVAMNDLYEIAKIPETEERSHVIEALAKGTAKSAAEARRSHNAAPVAPKDPVEEAFQALLSRWERAPMAVRRRFIDAIGDDLAEMQEGAPDV
jgi:ParB family chromosome partitioning protein